MRIILVSNQRCDDTGVGNPIVYRILKATLKDKRVDSAEFVPFDNSFKCLLKIRQAVRGADVVHVHFGGMYVLLVRLFVLGLSCCKFITFHGTDIHAKAITHERRRLEKVKILLNRLASLLCIPLFDKVGFVSEEMRYFLPSRLFIKYRDKFFIHSLGVDFDIFVPMPKTVALRHLGLKEKKYILFSDVSNTPIKRRDIAHAIANELPEYKLLIMCGVHHEEVPYYINVCDFLLLTSDQEGSPNIVRECHALNKPVFAVNVGDVSKQLEGLKVSSIIDADPKNAAVVIRKKMNLGINEDTRSIKKQSIDMDTTISKLIDLYSACTNNI